MPKQSLSVANETAVYVTGHIEGHETDMLLDTGSSVTLVHRRLFSRLGKNLPIATFRDPIVSANGELLDIVGTCKLRISLGGVDVMHSVLVAGDITQDCLLGVDFLSANKFKIDFEHHRLEVKGNTVALSGNSSENKPMVCRVSLAQTVTVPGEHEMVMQAKLTNQEGAVGVAGIVEASPGFAQKHSMLLARVLAEPGPGNLIPVRVINPSPTPVTLYQNTHLGTFTEVDRNPVCSAEEPETRRGLGTASSLFNLDNTDLTPPEKTQVADLLEKFKEIFSSEPNDLGRTSKVQHRIKTGDAVPVKQAARRVPGHQKEEIREHLRQMEDNHVIQPSSSPWASPIVLAKKKDGTTRFCVDYRKLNNVTMKDAYPLPRIADTLDSMCGARYFSTLDLASGYWQVELHPDDREKSAFATCYGLYEFCVMPFGLCNAPATFQRLMENVLNGLQWKTCLVYLDDVIVYSKTFDEHLDRLREVFERLQAAGLKLKPKKCQLFQRSVQYLGHIISEDGVKTDPEKIRTVAEWPMPITAKQVRSFLGLASYYRRFIQGFAEIAAPLYRLTENEAEFKWTDQCDEAFTRLKRQLTTAPVLAFPSFGEEFILDTDASNFGIGAVLSQVQNGRERVVAYASRAMTKAERKYSTTRKEMLAFVHFSKHFRHYLYGRRFVARTDHGALKWLHNFKEPEGQVARWLEQLGEFDFVVQHRPGVKHGNADAMSRSPSAAGEVQAVNATGTACAPRWTEDELSRLQEADLHLGHVINWLRAGDGRPSRLETQGISQETRTLLAQWDRLQLADGVLYRLWESEDGSSTRAQLVVPRCLVPEVLQSLHDASTAGHLGVTKTVAKVRERFYWPGLQTDVESWCRQCPKCETKKPPQRAARAPLVSSHAGYPMERVAVDILGPLPTSEAGNKYIMVVSDYFTKWTEAYAIPNQEARTVASRLVDEFVCRFGAPETLHSDQGRNFESKLMQEMCILLGIRKTRTTPYHPQSDGQVERFNRTLASMLSNYVADNHKDWDVHLPRVLMAYRSSEHETTRYSPFFLMFGREVRLPVDVMFGRCPQEQGGTTEYVDKLRRTLENAHERVRQNLQVAQRRQKDHYDVRAYGEKYAAGDRVWLHVPAIKKGQTAKFASSWDGPYEVLEPLSEVTYRIRKEGPRGKVKVEHFNNMKPCHSPRDRVAEQEHLDAEPPDGDDTTDVQNEAEQHYERDATDALYEEDELWEPEDVPVPVQPDRYQAPRDDGLPVQDRPRRAVRQPAWTRDFVLGH